MSDKILLFLIAMGLCFGSFRLITKLITKEPTKEATESPSTPKPPKIKPKEEPEGSKDVSTAPVEVSTTTTPAPEEAPPPLPPEPEEIIPPRLSDQKLCELFKVNGIAKSSQGSIVMINNMPLHEGDELGELRIEKITNNHAEVSYLGNIYQIAPRYLQEQIN